MSRAKVPEWAQGDPIAAHLRAVVPVRTSRGRWRLARFRIVAGVLGWLAPAAAGVAQAVVELSPVFVTASRSAEESAHVPFSHDAVGGEEIRDSASVTVDAVLRGIPEFSSFRRSDSLVANPSSQGVSLRGLGPTGASRSLVLLDGIPLTDAFGGWVLWSKVPRDSLARIELVPGAGGTAWGNAAMGGVIQLFTEPPDGRRERLALCWGSYNTRDLEAQVTEPVGPGTLQLLGRDVATDGYFVVAPERRGPIDRPATSDARSLTARWRQTFAGGVTATLTFRDFSDDRGNGTPYQRNHSTEQLAAAQLEARTSEAFRWNSTASVQREGFSSTFSAVNPARDAETPASNQFAVPATALGLAWVGEWSPRADARTNLGVDGRDVRGETREDSAYSDGGFMRRRFAGGRQSIAGAFVIHRRTLTPTLEASAGLRVDGWRDADGHRRDYAAGALAADQRFAARDGVELSPSAGVAWTPGPGLTVHVSGQQAFRRPTLNELYRPFRVGNVITDGNPALKTEHVTAGELGVEWRRGPLTAGITGFVNEFRDAVANVTLARGPVTLPGIGFVPAGGEGRRKMNLDRSRVQGISLRADWRVARGWSLEARYLYDDAVVTRASIAPWLVGRRLAQVPRQSGSLGLVWRQGAWSVTSRARWIDAQFDDDNNTLRLAPATLIDASASWTLRRGAEAFLSAENLWNHRLETGRSADGVVNIGSPRLLLVGIRLVR